MKRMTALPFSVALLGFLLFNKACLLLFLQVNTLDPVLFSTAFRTLHDAGNHGGIAILGVE